MTDVVELWACFTYLVKIIVVLVGLLRISEKKEMKNKDHPEREKYYFLQFYRCACNSVTLYLSSDYNYRNVFESIIYYE